MSTQKKEPLLIVIAGPTAIGKTKLAIEVAKHFRTEILSADSRQFFKELSIGTAVPSAEELALIKHHFIHSHSLTDEMNVGIYEQEVIPLIEKLFKKKNPLVLVGGSGLYIQAVCKGLDNLPAKDEALRTTLEKKTLVELQSMLAELDPGYFNEVDTQNPQRMMRAIEVSMLGGKPYSSYRTGQEKKRKFSILKIGLDLERGELYDHINKRADQMIAAGLEEEAKQMYPFRHLNALQTVGYSELFDYMDGKITRQIAIDLIKQNTRRFAKRQLTWFRRDKEIKWFHPEAHEEIIRYIEASIQK